VTITAVALLPIVVAAIRAIAQRQMPLGDNGLITLRANDVLTVNHPWFGTWTSASLSTGVDFNNPLPLHFDWLALWVKPFGLAVGSVLGAATLNMAAVIVAIRQGWLTASRRGETLMAIVVAGLSFTLGSEMLTDVWQPHNLVLPFAAFVACCIAVAAGRFRSLPWTVGVGSLIMGTHLSFTYVVVGGIAAAVVAGWWQERRRPSDGEPSEVQRRRTSVKWAVLVGLAAWSQALIEQFTSSGRGNLARLIDAQRATASAIGPRLGVRLFAQVVAMPPWWFRDSFTSSVPNTAYSAGHQLRPAGVVGLVPAILATAAVLALLALSAVRAWRRHDAVGVAWVWMAGCLTALALLTLSVMPAGVIGLAPHQMRWLWPIGALVMVGVLHLIDLDAAMTRAGWWVLAPVVCLALINLPAHRSDLGPAASRSEHATVRSLMDQLELVRLPGPTYFDGSTLQFAEPYSGAVLAALLDADQPVRADTPSFARQLGEHRHRHGDEQWSIQVRTGPAAESLAGGEQYIATAESGKGTAVAVVLIDRSAG
jgi:hypothetical protein